MSDLGQKELDKLNPKASPTPDPTHTSNPQPSPTPTNPAPSPTPTVTPKPSPTPTNPAPSPTPTVTATPSPTPTSPAPSPTPTVVPKAGADKFNVPALDSPKVDMLFCIDNSGSMADKQQVLADSMSTFIGLFVAGGVDYHIGVVTTDTDSTDAKYWSNRLPNYVTPNRGRLLSRYTEKFLSKNSSSVVDKMKANAKVGTSGSGSEQCFNSMLYALDDSILGVGGFNEGFVRDDALLSMIVVSDEDEDIRNGEGVAGRIDRMKKRISAIKGPNSRGFSFDFVINKTASKPGSPVTYPLDNSNIHPYPNFYFAAADAFVSKTYDVLKNFGSDLAKIGSDIVVASTSQFKLSNKPNPASSIVVKLDGKLVAADPVNGYVYDASNNSITLKGDALAASPGGVLTIDYLY
ncbi:MAG: hypothetical protein JST04_06655 [Bdellovibrionales bacterium]|nr:hypothetical protein [Bdellovibrionales bacterium]